MTRRLKRYVFIIFLLLAHSFVQAKEADVSEESAAKVAAAKVAGAKNEALSEEDAAAAAALEAAIAAADAAATKAENEAEEAAAAKEAAARRKAGVPFEYGFLVDIDTKSERLSSDTNNDGQEINVPVKNFYFYGRFSAWFDLRLTRFANIYTEFSYFTKSNSADKSAAANENATELDRLEISIKPNDDFFLNIGRVKFNDLLGSVAFGVFDGGNLILSSDKNRIGFGVFYTGLLYKGSANLTMNKKDIEAYSENKYLAPSHTFISIDYTHTRDNFIFGINFLHHSFLRKEIPIKDLFSELALQLKGEELPESLRREELFENIYTELLFSFFYDDTFSLNLEGTLGITMQNYDGISVYEYSVIPALNMFYMMRYPFTSRLGAELKWYSGNFNDKAEMPVITRKQLGYAYDGEQTNLFAFKAQYTAYLTSKFSFETSFSLFARTSKDVMPYYWYYGEFENHNSDKYLLGSEYVIMFIADLFSDFSFDIGVVLFFPDAGIDNNVYNASAPVKWDIIMGVKFSL